MVKGLDKSRKYAIIYSVPFNIAELCKGSTAVSDSACLGSNPSSAAKKILSNHRQDFLFYFLRFILRQM